jgi:multidrug efflux pump subunit AcrB
LKKFWIWTGVTILLGLALVYPESSRLLGAILLVFGFMRIIYRFLLKPVSHGFQTKAVTWMEAMYTRTLRFALDGVKPYFFLGGTLALLVISLMIFFSNMPPVTLFPENEPNYVNVFIEMPQGTDILHTNEVTKKLEQRIDKTLEPYRPVVEAMLAQVGEGTSDPNAGNFMQGSTPTKARITVSFLEYEERIKHMDVSTSNIMKKISEAVHGIPEPKSISVEKNQMGPPVGKPVSLEVTGEDYDQLIDLTLDIKNHLENANVPGVEGLKTDLEASLPEMEITVDRDAARRFGVSTYTMASAIRTALFGKEVDKYKIGEDDYPINIRLQDEQRYDLSTLLNMSITFRDPGTGRIKQVPISSVVKVKNSSTLGSVQRKDQQRVITIFSNVLEGYNANEIVARYQQIMQNYDMPQGFSYKFTGEQQEQTESMDFLQNAMLIAVFLIFLIIVSQFNSVTSPIIILFSVVFSTIGVFLGFSIFQIDISIIMVGVGIISLAGIVVNNAIVLIDFIYLSRDRRRSDMGIKPTQTLPYKDIVESVVTAGRIRFRPVILTAITTVLGLVPLATGFNIDFYGLFTQLSPNIYFGGDSAIFWGPMAWTVIFGLVFSTFLTLVIIPVMYLIIDNMMRKGRALYLKWS